MKIAVVQQPPVLLDRSRTLAAAVVAVRDAAAAGAELIVFPEALVPGYPAWIWRLRPGTDMALAERLHASCVANAVRLDARRPRAAAATRPRAHGVTIVCGIDERDAECSRSTLYNTVVVIAPDGTLAQPASQADADQSGAHGLGLGRRVGVKVVDTPCGRSAR